LLTDLTFVLFVIQVASKTKSFRDVLSNFYVERKCCFATFAPREGMSTGTSIVVRLKQNEKRRLKRDRPKAVDEESRCPNHWDWNRQDRKHQVRKHQVLTHQERKGSYHQRHQVKAIF
jgi:hypothetical protein